MNAKIPKHYHCDLYGTNAETEADRVQKLGWGHTASEQWYLNPHTGSFTALSAHFTK